ncbi:MAG TPA: alpha/beta hydrolase [Pirellulales bacterium]|nr:alpha/beta hydrolase [Pirellulales bacterium]
MRRIRRSVWIATLITSQWLSLSRAAAIAARDGDLPAPPEQDSPAAWTKFWSRVTRQTFGGAQLWADELVYGHWRIQRSALSGNYRLLDSNECRRACGSFEDCQQALDAAKVSESLSSGHRRVIVLLHGLWGWRQHMGPMHRYLQRRLDADVISVGYPSSRGDLNSHAASLAKVIDHLQGVEQLDFVAHSMGNVVLRCWLMNEYESQRADRPQIGRIVMLGPPNNGSAAARFWHGGPASRLAILVAGRSARQLGPGWSTVVDRLATPACEFGVIAGGLNDDEGFSPRLPGDDDGVVEVETTRLAGARDFLLLPVWHPLMMMHPQVQESTLRFLEQGCFISEEARVPIED